MARLRTWIKNHQITAFYLITFAITWGLGFSYIGVMQNDIYWLAPLFFVATCGPALAGIIVTAVAGGQTRPQLGPQTRHNRTRWIVFLAAMVICTAVFLLHNKLINGAPVDPTTALLLILGDRMWQRLPQEGPAVSPLPRPAV